MAHANVLHQLAGLLDLRAHQIEHHGRNQQLRARHRARLSLHGAHAGQKVLHFLTRHNRAALLAAHAVKTAAAGGHPSVHAPVLLLVLVIRRILLFLGFGLLGGSLRCLQLDHLSGELRQLLFRLDALLLDLLLLRGERGIVGGKLLRFGLDGLLIGFTRRFVQFVERLFQLLLALFERSAAGTKLAFLLLDGFKARANLLLLTPVQNHSECHDESSLSCPSSTVPAPGGAWPWRSCRAPPRPYPHTPGR